MPGVRRVINGDAFDLLPAFAYAEPVRDEWEAPLYARFKQALAPGMTVLDVGASFGLFTIAAARAVAPAGRVFAFEPAPSTASALRVHVEWNAVADRVEVVEAAASGSSGGETFWEQETSFVASLLEPAARQEETRFETPVARRAVAALTLDDFCRTRRIEPDVLKVDVEGAESEVLRGARDLLARRKATLFLELHDGLLASAGGSPDAPLRELEAAGWRCEEVHVEAATRHYACVPA